MYFTPILSLLAWVTGVSAQFHHVEVCSNSVVTAAYPIVVGLRSNTTYVLTNCSAHHGSEPFVIFAPNMTSIENVVVNVASGNVLPLIALGDLGPDGTVSNITVSLHNVHVGPLVYRYHPRTNATTPLAVFSVENATTIRHVALIVTDSTIDVTAVSSNTSVSSVQTLFVHISRCNMEDVNVSVQRSAIRFAYLMTEASTVNLGASLVDVAVATSAGRIRLDIANSTVALDVNATAVVAQMPSNDQLCVLLVTCSEFGACNVSDVVFNAAMTSSITVQYFAPSGILSLGNTNTSSSWTGNTVYVEVFAIIGTRWCDQAQLLLSGPRTSVTSRAICTASCVGAPNELFAAFVFHHDARLSATSRVRIVAKEVHFVVESSTYAAIVRFERSVIIESPIVSLTSCSATIVAWNLLTDARYAAVVAVQGRPQTSRNMIIELADVRADFRVESGGCTEAGVMVVNLSGDSYKTYVTIANTTVTSSIVNGTVQASGTGLGTAAYLSMYSVLIKVAPISGQATASELHLEISDSSIASEHFSSLPALQLIVVASAMAAVQASSTVVDSNIRMSNVSVVRSHTPSAGPSTWFPPFMLGEHRNVTALVMFMGSLAVIPAAYLEMLTTVSNLRASPAAHSNTTTVVTSCSVAHDQRLGPPSSTDVIFLVAPPTTLNASSSVVVEASTVAVVPNGNVAVATGSLVRCFGGVAMNSSAVALRQIEASSGLSLFSIDNMNLTLAENSSIICDSVALTYPQLTGPSGDPFSNGVGFVTLLAPSSITVATSHFSGFDAIFSSVVVRGASSPSSAAQPLISIGCDTSWNGKPLLHVAVADAALRTFVTTSPFPCSSNTTTMSVALQHQQGNTSKQNAVRQTAASTAASSVLVYATVFPIFKGIGGAAVASIQRAAAALRLASICVSNNNLGEEEDTAVSTDQDSDEGSPMFSQLLDNPLHLAVPVGTHNLRYAAGAAIGNLLLVSIVSVTLSCLDKAQHRALRKPQTWTTKLLLVLPSCPGPGAPGASIGKYIQPSVGACTALLVSPQRTNGASLCGVAMLVLWAAYPAYCAGAILWRGRRQVTFVLSAIPQRTPAVRRLSNFARATMCILEETCKWTIHRGCRRGTADRKYAEFLLRNMEAVFGAFVGGREWYFAVEWGIAAASGAVLGAAEAVAAGGDACTAARWGGGSAVALCMLQLGLCVWLRPFSVRLELWMAVLLGCLELLSNALSLAALIDAADTIVSISAILEVLIGLVGIPMLLVVIQRHFTSWARFGVHHQAVSRVSGAAVVNADRNLYALVTMICNKRNQDKDCRSQKPLI